MDFCVEDLPRVFASDLFDVEWTIPFCNGVESLLKNSSSMVPSVEDFTAQESFADLYLGYSNEELIAVFDVGVPISQTFYPEFKKGDAIELIIDTHPKKDQSITTRFVHHFVILPTPYEGVVAKEITRFRGNDSRSLVPDELIKVSVTAYKKSYRLVFRLPLISLKGFDEKTSCLGIGYRIHRYKGEFQEFPHNSQSVHFDVHPGLLASALLGKK